MILPPDDYTRIDVHLAHDGAVTVRLLRRSTGVELGWAVRESRETSWLVWAPDDMADAPLGRATDLRHAASQLRHFHRRVRA